MLIKNQLSYNSEHAYDALKYSSYETILQKLGVSFSGFFGGASPQIYAKIYNSNINLQHLKLRSYPVVRSPIRCEQ
jgi:hypothetical protein